MSTRGLVVLAVACLAAATFLWLPGSDDGGSRTPAETVESSGGSAPRSDLDIAIDAVSDDPLTDMVADRYSRRGVIGVIHRLVGAVGYVLDNLLAPLLMIVALGAALVALRR
ncbi:MAG: hypothetical protein GXY03_13795 [Solirubrobacterales bacterium]|nr:hypothetical protein [Solirubrobacterales bacterium]